MLQPRRQRMLMLPLLSLVVLTIFSTISSAATAVLGIDIGTEYIKVGVIKHGAPKDIILTKDSRRKEASTLAFKPSTSGHGEFPERLYGADAVALSARFPGDVYPNLKSLLGARYGSEVQSTYSNNYPGLKLEGVERDGSGFAAIGIRSETLGTAQPPFLVEELLAMELKNVLANAKAAVPKGMTAKDAVITYPAFYTADEKRAVEFAAQLAGVRVLGLMTDGAAVAVDYGASRSFPGGEESGGKPEFHVIYDMGAGSTTATVVKYSSRDVKDVGKFNKTVQEVQVVGIGWDRTLGGDLFNQVIVEDIVSKFVESKKAQALNIQASQVRQHGRTMAKIWKESERMRQMLSANTETAATFEGLFHEDAAFKYKLTRSEFETLSMNFADRTRAPLIQALEAAKISVEGIESIILHGGATRTPFVQKQLEATAGGSEKVRTNVNADESACLGAALRAALISPAFRITKDLRIQDFPGYAAGLKWNSDGKERTQKIFTTSSTIGTEKVLPFKNQEDFTLQFFQSINGLDVPVTQIKASNLTASIAHLKDLGCVPANISTKFATWLSPFDGLPEILRGSVSCEIEPTKEGGIVDGVKGLFGFGSKKDGEQEPLKAEESESSSTASSDDSSSEDSASSSTSSSSKSDDGPSSSTHPTTSSTSTSTTTKSSKKSKPTPTGPYTTTVPIALSTNPMGLGSPPSETSLSDIKARLKAFDTSDKARLDRAEALNSLESYTYKTRDYLEDAEFKKHSTADARNDLAKKLSATSEWLYEDGLNAKTADYKAKLKDLKSLAEPVLSRMRETKGRGKAMRKLSHVITKMDETIVKIEKTVVDAIEEDRRKSAEEERLIEILQTSDIDWFAETPIAASDWAKASSSSSSSVDDLEGDPYSSASTDTSSSDSAKSTEPPELPQSRDLETLKRLRNETGEFHKEKVAAQENLKPTEDPAYLVKDIEYYAEDVAAQLQKIQNRQERLEKKREEQEKKKKEKEQKEASSSSKSSKSTKTSKAKKGKSTSSKTTSASSANTSESPKSDRKDEL